MTIFFRFPMFILYRFVGNLVKLFIMIDLFELFNMHEREKDIASMSLVPYGCLSFRSHRHPKSHCRTPQKNINCLYIEITLSVFLGISVICLALEKRYFGLIILLKC